jgi:prolyl 4-hydroxylase
MFFRPVETPFIGGIERRFAELMNCPLENGEGLQVLYYGPGCKSEPHFDFLMPSNPTNTESLARSGQRITSLVVYLNDVAGGGETYFPDIGLAVFPRQGNAVYFEYANSRAQVDYRSLHASAAVTHGEKWAVTKWMRERRFIPAHA